MKWILLPFAAAALTFTGCVESGLNDADQVVVSGKALQADKSPAANTSLQLYRSGNSVCALMEKFKDVTTDAAGAYTFELTGLESKNGDIARCFQLRFAPTAEGAQATVDFLVQVTEVSVPELQLWGGSPQVMQSGAGVTVGFTGTQESHGFSAAPIFRLNHPEGLAWEQTKASSPVAVSGYVLEDFAGLKAQFDTSNEVKGSGVAFHLSYASDSAEVPQKSLVPVSRGASCVFGTKTFASACPFTDGHIVPVAEEGASELRITLSGAKALKKLVARGVTANIGARLVFSGSADDGVTWTKLGEIADVSGQPFFEVGLDATAPASKIFRITAEGQNQPKLLGVNEVSLFE